MRRYSQKTSPTHLALKELNYTHVQVQASSRYRNYIFDQPCWAWIPFTVFPDRMYHHDLQSWDQSKKMLTWIGHSIYCWKACRIPSGLHSAEGRKWWGFGQWCEQWCDFFCVKVCPHPSIRDSSHNKSSQYLSMVWKCRSFLPFDNSRVTGQTFVPARIEDETQKSLPLEWCCKVKIVCQTILWNTSMNNKHTIHMSDHFKFPLTLIFHQKGEAAT